MTDQPTLPAKTQITAGGPVAALVPQSLDEAFRLSQALAMSGLAPKGMEKPEQIMVAIIAGAELGLAPFQALQSFAVINGRPTLWGDGLMAVARSQGVQCREWVEGAGDKCEAFCEVTRPDTGEQITRSFSVEDARKASLWGKSGPWQSYPKRMLGMRARAWALRDGCADMLRGFQVREEVEDYQPIRDVTPVKTDLRAKLTGNGEGEGFSAAHVAEQTGDKPKRAAKAQETQAGGVGDTLDGDDLPASVKEARPTGTAGAPSAETPLATSGSATDASTASPGPGDSSRDSFGEQVREVMAEEEQPEVIAEGSPAPDEVYHLDGDVWDQEGRRDTYKNGTPFSSAGRKAGLSIYADHAPTEETVPEGEDGGDGDLPTEFKAYVEQVEAATSWQEVKKAMAVFYRTELFMGMRPDQQNKIRCNTWEIMVENKLPDLPDQAIDISAFRLWIEWCPDADAIEGTMRIWKDDAKYREERPPEFKRQIEGAVAERIAALGGLIRAAL